MALFVLLLALAILFPAVPAQADVLIMPIRVVFENRDRTSDIMVINTSSERSTFRLEWRHTRQTVTGGYDKLDEPLSPHFDPETMIVFTPRQFTLPPNGRQRVRIALRRPPDLPEGEYRGHISLMRVDRSHVISAGGVGGGVQTTLNMRVGFAVPVVVRHGEKNVSVTISDPHFEPAPGGRDDRPRLTVFLNRTGTHGAMGRLKVFWQPAGGGEEQEIGVLNNVNVYGETARREARIPLRINNIPGGKIRVVYEGDGPDRGIILDERVFPVGG